MNEKRKENFYANDCIPDFVIFGVFVLCKPHKPKGAADIVPSRYRPCNRNFLFIFVGDDAHIVPSATGKERTLSGRMWSSAPTGV